MCRPPDRPSPPPARDSLRAGPRGLTPERRPSLAGASRNGTSGPNAPRPTLRCRPGLPGASQVRGGHRSGKRRGEAWLSLDLWTDEGGVRILFSHGGPSGPRTSSRGAPSSGRSEASGGARRTHLLRTFACRLRNPFGQGEDRRGPLCPDPPLCQLGDPELAPGLLAGDGGGDGPSRVPRHRGGGRGRVSGIGRPEDSGRDKWEGALPSGGPFAKGAGRSHGSLRSRPGRRLRPHAYRRLIGGSRGGSFWPDRSCATGTLRSLKAPRRERVLRPKRPGGLCRTFLPSLHAPPLPHRNPLPEPTLSGACRGGGLRPHEGAGKGRPCTRAGRGGGS